MMVEESDEQRDSGGGAAMAALHQCELIQNMIDISISSLQGLRTKCAASNDLTQQEIRTLEVITTSGAEVQRHERADPLSRARFIRFFLFLHCSCLLWCIIDAQGAWKEPLLLQFSIISLTQSTIVLPCFRHGNTMEFRHYYAIFLETLSNGIRTSHKNDNVAR